jgi:hypothetical protein
MGDNHKPLATAGTIAGIGLVLSLIGYAHAAAVLDAQGADQLLARGNLGLAALVVLGVLAPIGVTVTAAAVLVRRIVANSNASLEHMTALFAAQLSAQQAEREGMADAHRLERQEAMRAENAERKVEREERQRTCERHLEHDEATLQALQALVQRANGGK